MPEPDWHGWSIERGPSNVARVAYHVSRHPARKRIALLRYTPGLIEAAAYFTTEAHAEAFLEWLDTLAENVPRRSIETINPDDSVL